MINNRQGGRRRGRGGQRPQGMPGNSGGNARDSRQRGNAAQLLEKYKNMARDSQLAGDRVQTEYYLQFADHYFRVLGEGRARFEEQRRQNGDDDGEDEGEEMAEAEGEAYDESDRQPRRRPHGRDERPERFERAERGEQDSRRERRPAGNGRSSEDLGETSQRIPFDALPPAIGGDAPARDGDDGETAPRARRVRRTRAVESDGETDGAAA